MYEHRAAHSKQQFAEVTSRFGNDLDCPGGPNAHRRVQGAESGPRSGGQQVAVEALNSGGRAQAALKRSRQGTQPCPHTDFRARVAVAVVGGGVR